MDLVTATVHEQATARSKRGGRSVLLATDRLQLALKENQAWRERSQWMLING